MTKTGCLPGQFPERIAPAKDIWTIPNVYAKHWPQFCDKCPVPNRTATYLKTVENNYRCTIFDNSLLADNRIFPSAEEAWHFIEENKHLLKTDTLIHGDYCLPNIILEDWHLSKFIDVGNGGVGDRHIDLFWGIWSLGYNLKTHAYADRFLDAYGWEAVEPELLRLIAACECFG